MYDWTALNRSVKDTLASDSLGAPVFVRWTAAAAQRVEDLKTLLAMMSLYSASWLAAGPRRLYATGAEAQGHLSLALDYENGSSSLLALTLAHNRPHTYLAIYGARGAIYHNDSTLPPRLEDAFAEVGENAILTAALPLAETIAAIDDSLSGKRPVSLSG